MHLQRADTAAAHLLSAHSAMSGLRQALSWLSIFVATTCGCGPDAFAFLESLQLSKLTTIKPQESFHSFQLSHLMVGPLPDSAVHVKPMIDALLVESGSCPCNMSRTPLSLYKQLLPVTS